MEEEFYTTEIHASHYHESSGIGVCMFGGFVIMVFVIVANLM